MAWYLNKRSTNLNNGTQIKVRETTSHTVLYAPKVLNPRAENHNSEKCGVVKNIISSLQRNHIFTSKNKK